MTGTQRANLIARAKEALKSLTEETLKKDLGLAFKPDSINAFVVLKSHAPSEWARLKSILQKAKISIRDLNAQMKPARAKLRLVERGAKDSRTVGSMLGVGCPVPTLVVPDPYVLTPEAILEFLDDVDPPGQVTVAFAPVIIVRRFSDAETGTESLELSWRRDGKWQNLVKDRGVIMDPKKLLGLASLGFPCPFGKSA